MHASSAVPRPLSTTRMLVRVHRCHDACGIDAPCTVAAHAVVAVYMIAHLESGTAYTPPPAPPHSGRLADLDRP